VKAIRDLHSVRSATLGSFCVSCSAIPSDDLHPGMRAEPTSEGVRLPVWEQLDGTAFLEIHQDGAVVAALAFGPIVDSEDAGRALLWAGGSSNESE